MSSIVDKDYVQKYNTVRVTTTSGKVRSSMTTGDSVAQAMFGFERDDLEEIVRKNDLEDKMAKHADKPNGQYRMNLGNILRGMLRKGKPVIISPFLTLTSLDQKVDISDRIAPAPQPRVKAEKPPKEAKPPRERKMGEKPKNVTPIRRKKAA